MPYALKKRLRQLETNKFEDARKIMEEAVARVASDQSQASREWVMRPGTIAQLAAAKPEPILVSIQDAGLMLGGLTRSSIYRLIDAGKLKPLYIGRRTLFKVSDIKAFVASLDGGAK